MNLTNEAKDALKRALIKFDQPGAGIHLYSAQGCCGPSVKMEISTQPGLNETKLSMDEIDFYVGNDILDTIQGITMEYSSRGFVLNGLEKGGSCCN